MRHTNTKRNVIQNDTKTFVMCHLLKFNMFHTNSYKMIQTPLDVPWRGHPPRQNSEILPGFFPKICSLFYVRNLSIFLLRNFWTYIFARFVLWCLCVSVTLVFSNGILLWTTIRGYACVGTKMASKKTKTAKTSICSMKGIVLVVLYRGGLWQSRKILKRGRRTWWCRPHNAFGVFWGGAWLFLCDIGSIHSHRRLGDNSFAARSREIFIVAWSI